MKLPFVSRKKYDRLAKSTMDQYYELLSSQHKKTLSVMSEPDRQPTLRQWYAGMAMQMLHGTWEWDRHNNRFAGPQDGEVAKMCFSIADAMTEESTIFWRPQEPTNA